MKKLVLLPFCIVLSLAANHSHHCHDGQPSPWMAAFTSGYVFKHDDNAFKNVYGQGIGNVMTGDLCYYFCNNWGVGAKASYWLAVGRTTFFRTRAFLQEIPMTAYVRKAFDFDSGLRIYGSLGGGAIWSKEKANGVHTKIWKGIGEAEAGLNFPVCNMYNFTFAFRYLFPRQKVGLAKRDFGGFDLRAGLGINF